MKKLFFTILFMFSITIWAEEPPLFFSEYSNRFEVDDGIEDLSPITIIATAENQITSNNNINIIIEENLEFLFHNNTEVKITGTAASKVTDFSYDEKHRKFTINLNDSLLKDETILINNLQVRIYDEESGGEKLVLDINNDNIVDVYDVNVIEISEDDDAKDTMEPFPVTNLKAIYQENKAVLSWENPIDFDFSSIFIEKKQNDKISELSFGEINTLEDTEITIGDVLEYKVYASDGRNKSEATTVNLTIAETTPPEVTNDNENSSNNDTGNENNSNSGNNNNSSDDTNSDNSETTAPSTAEETQPEEQNNEPEAESDNKDNKDDENNTETESFPELETEIIANDKPQELTATELQSLAQTVSEIKAPKERLQAIRNNLKNLTFKNKIRFVRYVVEIIN